MTLISRLEKYCLTPAMAGFEDEMIKSLRQTYQNTLMK